MHEPNWNCFKCNQPLIAYPFTLEPPLSKCPCCGAELSWDLQEDDEQPLHYVLESCE